MTNQLIDKYEALCTQIIEAFSKKQDLVFEFWVSDKIGETACFDNEWFFNLSEMVFDLKTNQPKGLIVSWHDQTVEANQDLKHEERKFINYPSYCMGARYDLFSDLAEIKETMLNNKPTGYFKTLKDFCIVY